MELPNVKGIAEKVGFTVNTIKSGQLKDTGNMFRDMSEEERAYLQKTARDTHTDFIAAVVNGRKLDPVKVANFADGRVFIGREAVNLGVVDKLGDVYDAAREVYVELGKPLADDKEPKLYYPLDNFREFKEILKGTTSLVKAFPMSPRLTSQLE